MDKNELVNKIRGIEGLTNDEKSALIEMLRKQKKYGLVWEDKPEDVEERLREELPMLIEDTDKAIISTDTDAPNHILIEGDNLEALTALAYTHEGNIDVIYIDPPYNTGNKDFVYNDKFVDSEDSYRHSKWLSFMNKRLRIAKQLLSDKGVIFISIDDNEHAQLKLLCDEVFGLNNLLSLYNMTVEEARGNVRGREYHGLVYSVTDDAGNKTGNPFKSSLFGKSAGYEAVQKKFARSKQEIKDRKLADMTKRTVLSVLEGTYDKEKFVSRLKEKGIDTVLRYTEEGRIYGATFIDHRTGCVLNGSRMGKELSANALQEHFTLPYAGQPPIPLSVPVETEEDMRGQTASDHENTAGGVGLLTPEGPAVDAEEEAFIRAMQRKRKKKRRKGLGM